MNPKLAIQILLIFLCQISGRTQNLPILKLDEAVKNALENSFNVKIAAQAVDVAKVYNNIGTAGVLPTLSLNASYGGSLNNIDQRFSNGLQVQQNGVSNNNTNANASLNWVFFDGLRMVYAKQRLSLQQQMSETVLGDSIQSLMSQVMMTYYKAIAAKQQITTFTQILQFATERLEISESKFKSGSSDKTIVLQAQLDLNTLKSMLIEQKLQLRKCKISLNLLMGKPIDEDYEIDNEIPVTSALDYKILRSEAEKNNPRWKTAKFNIQKAKLEQKELQAFQYPWLSASASYGYNLTRNQAGFALYNQNLGFNYGIGLSYPIFSGYTVRPQLKAASIQTKIMDNQLNFIILRIESQLKQMFTEYETAMELYRLQEENLKPANENLEIAMARFRVGTSDQIALRTAQQSFEEVSANYINSKIKVKQMELQLLQLAGMLVK